MATAEQFLNYNYNNNNNSSDAGNWFSDTFLGTNKQQNKANVNMMNEQNRFTEYMSNTAYQRGMQDMVAAGINPMVMYASQGGSAKATSPSSSNLSAGNYDSSGGMVGKALILAGKTYAKMVNNMVDNLSGKALKLVKNMG